MNRVDHADPRHANVTVVDWNLGNSCNQACSYCPLPLRDGSRPWPTSDVVLQFVERVAKHYSSIGRQVFFQFTGGEVTLMPHFHFILRETRKVAGTGIVSNGRRAISWWRAVRASIDAVVITYHAEFASFEHIRDVVQVLIETSKVHVNVAMLPDRFDECAKTVRRLTEIAPGTSVTAKPLLRDFKGPLYDYSDDQLRLMSDLGAIEQMPVNLEKGVRGRMIVSVRAGTRLMASTTILRENLNEWRGWTCTAGIESLAVRSDGRVFRATCMEGGLIGTIYSDIDWPAETIVCAKSACTCLADITLTRWRM